MEKSKENGQHPAEFTTQGGMKLVLHPIPRIRIDQLRLAVRKEYKDRGEPIDPPTYSYTVLGGDQETAILDDMSAEDPTNPEQTAKNKRLLLEHRAAMARMDSEARDRVTSAMLALGVVLDPADIPQEWDDDQKWLGVEVPTDPRDKKVQYLITAVLSDPDMVRLILELQTLSLSGMVDDSLIEAARESFRRALQEQGRAAFRDIEAQVGRLVAQSEVLGSEGGEGVGIDAE